MGAVSHIFFTFEGSTSLVVYSILTIGVARAILVQKEAAKAIFWGLLDQKELVLTVILLGAVVPASAVAIVLFVERIEPGWTLAIGSTAPFTSSTMLLPLVLAPITETLLLQVWLQTLLSRLPWVSFLVGTVVFMAIHLRIDLPLLASAVALCGARAFLRSSGAALIAHALTNFIIFIFFLR